MIYASDVLRLTKKKKTGGLQRIFLITYSSFRRRMSALNIKEDAANIIR